MNSDRFKTCMKSHLLNIYNQISFYQYSVYVFLASFIICRAGKLGFS
jgi:hypothetical protein